MSTLNLILSDPDYQNIEGVLRGAVGFHKLAGNEALLKQAQEALDAFICAVQDEVAEGFDPDSDCEKNHRECEAPDLCAKCGHCMGA